MKQINEQEGKRHMIRRDGKNYYLYISDTDIMFSGPGESSVQHQDKFSQINLICRMVSLARNQGVSWEKILKQFDNVDVTGGRTMVRDIAQAIRDSGVC